MNKLLYSVSTAPAAKLGAAVAKYVNLSAMGIDATCLNVPPMYSPLCHDFICRHVYMNVISPINNSLLNEIKNLMLIESRKHMYETQRDFAS
jgi:hypothetical protein